MSVFLCAPGNARAAVRCGAVRCGGLLSMSRTTPQLNPRDRSARVDPGAQNRGVNVQMVRLAARWRRVTVRFN